MEAAAPSGRRLISPPARALMMLIASGVTARRPSRSVRPRPTRIRLALGESCKPAPTSSSRSVFSSTTTRKPRAASASAAVNPPIPAPATKMVRDVATTLRSGDVLQHAFGGASLAGAEVRGEPEQRRAIRADDLAVVAEIEKNMGVIERRIGAHAHEFLRADLDDRNSGIVVEVRDDIIGHHIHLGWQRSGRNQHDQHTPRQVECRATYRRFALIPSASSAYANSTQSCRRREALLSSGLLCLKSGTLFYF